MKKLVLKIVFDTENDAFRNTSSQIDSLAITNQLDRTVSKVREHIKAGKIDEIHKSKISDRNGNTVGHVHFEWPNS